MDPKSDEFEAKVKIEAPGVESSLTITSPEEWDVLVTLLEKKVRQPLETSRVAENEDK